MGVAGVAATIVLSVLVVLATAGTVWLVKVRPALEHDPDSRFWYVFAGLVVLLPVVLITAVLNRGAGAVLALLAVGTWWWANAALSRRLAVQALLAKNQRAQAEAAVLASRHDAVLLCWSRYELDPGAAIDFPVMADVRDPLTSALAKALARAQQLRGDTDRAGTGDYRDAVVGLEQAFARAEQAALNRSCG